MKTAERRQARLLRRRDGCSVKEIARLLGVSRSSVSLWVRDIELTPQQHATLQERNPAYNAQRNGWAANVERGRNRRRAYQEHGRELARGATPLHLAGCMLYWAEGGRSRNDVRFTNSDPEMVRLFVSFLRQSMGVLPQNILITCNLFADHEQRQREIEQFWLAWLSLPAASLRTSVINRYSRYSKKKRRNKLAYGTCRVVVHSTEIVQMIYGSIQAFAGFDRPAWIDC
jgi:transcriptional regulator with XRE-family HTH domain